MLLVVLIGIEIAVVCLENSTYAGKFLLSLLGGFWIDFYWNSVTVIAQFFIC